MSVETTHIATCDRCGQTQVLGWDAVVSPDGDILPPNDWRLLRGGAIEEILYDSADICVSCQDDLDEWMRNDGQKSQG